MDLFESAKSFVVRTIAHHLDPFSFLFKVVEDQVFSTGSNTGDSARNRSLLLKPFSFLGDGFVLLDEVMDCDCYVEFMGIGISLFVLFELKDHLRSVFKIGCRIKYFLLFFSLFFLAFIGLIFLCFFGGFLCFFLF